MRVLPLGPLTDADAGRLLLQLAPEGEQMPAVLPAIVRRAGGVPFFLVSYAEQVSGGGQGGTPLAVPWTVAQVIGQRVAALPGPAKELLSVAAVAGRVVPHTLLAQVTGSDDEQVLEAVETAMEARLLAEDGPDGYRFTHDLIRETVENGLSAARRRRLHRRIGQALEHQPGVSAESLAFHFSHSGEDGTAAGYLELAGDQAQQRVAYAAAAEFYAAAAARLQAAGRPAEVVPVTEKQGVAWHRAGRYDAAISALEGALAGYRAAGDAESAARVTGRLANAHYRRGTSHDALGELADMAEGDPAPAPGAASPGTLTWWEGLLLLLYAQGSYTKMVTLGRSLAQAGRAADNSQMQAIGTRVEGGALIHLGRLAEGAALMAAALPADPQPGDERAVQAASLLSAAYLAMGSMDHCAALSERMLAAAERASDQLVIAMHTAMLAGVCYVRGDWDRGRDLVGRALECFAASSSPVAVRWVGLLAPVLIWHGAWDQARAYLEGSLQAARSVQLVSIEWTALTHLADLDLLDGRPRDAVTRLHPVTADRPLPAVEDLTWDTPVELLSVLAQAHLEVGDLDRARAYAGRAVGHARRMGAWVQGIRALEVHGMVLARDGDHDLARAAYQEGLDRARAMPFPYGQARLLHACGLLDRQQQDHAAAHAKFAQALTILEHLGADHDAGRLRQVTGTRSASGSLFTGTRRRPAAMTGLDVIAAGISAVGSAGCGTGCVQLPGVDVGYQARSRLRRGDGGEVGAGLAVIDLAFFTRRVPSPGSGTRCSRSPCCSPLACTLELDRDIDGIPCRPAEQGPVAAGGRDERHGRGLGRADGREVEPARHGGDPVEVGNQRRGVAVGVEPRRPEVAGAFVVVNQEGPLGSERGAVRGGAAGQGVVPGCRGRRFARCHTAWSR